MSFLKCFDVDYSSGAPTVIIVSIRTRKLVSDGKAEVVCIESNEYEGAVAICLQLIQLNALNCP